MKLSIFHSHFLFTIQGQFCNRLFKQDLPILSSSFSDEASQVFMIKITNKIMLLLIRQGTLRFLCRLQIYETSSLCGFPQRQRLVCSCCSVRNQHFQAFGTDIYHFNHGRPFSGQRKIIQQQHKMTERYRDFKTLLPFPKEPQTKRKLKFSTHSIKPSDI